MRIYLSWRQKFLALVIVAPAGLLFITVTVFQGFETVSSSYQFIHEVARYENAAVTLVTHWNRLEKQLSNYATSDADIVQKRLNTLSVNAELLKQQAVGLNDPDTLNSAEGIAQRTGAYVAARKAWLEQLTALGSTDSQGIRQKLGAAFDELESLELSLFDKALTEIYRTNTAYFASLGRSFREEARAALDNMEAKIKEYAFDGSVVDDRTQVYRALFDRSDAVTQKLVDADRRAERAGLQLQQQVLAQAEELDKGLVAESIAAAESSQASAKTASLGAIAVFTPLFMLILMLTSNALVRQLNRVINLLSRVSNGDLTGKLALSKNPHDEFNKLGAATNQMIDNIGHLMRQTVRSTNSLLEVHGELDKAMQRLARNNAQVESQTVQAATASQEISVTINDIANRTSQVGASTQAANESAHAGAHVVESSAEATRRLSAMIQQTHSHVQSLTNASTKVTGIIDVINGLAGQTNLLALNAAIEASRAGEKGRGFSVVADEVRSLAQKTVAATTNIVGIVDELNKQTKRMDTLTTDGLELARDSERSASHIADAMGGVTTSIEALNSEMEQVVVAVEEISVTTDDIAHKMEDIRSQSTETQSIGNELGTLNDQLSQQAKALAESTRKFRVGEP